MAIGTALAIAGATAAASIGGSVLSSKAQKKAANKASDTAQQTADANNALTRDIYNQNYATLSPYAQRGNEAGNAINALLGLGVPQQQATTPLGGQTQGPTNYGRFSAGNIGEFGDFFIGVDALGRIPGNIGGFAGGTYNSDGTQVTPVQAPQSTQQDYEDAFQNYRNSTGYQFRLNEGNNAVNSGYAAAGALRSGAALKDLSTFNQNIASDEFGNYLGQLANQQGVGLSGASAIAGVGQNYVNNVTANNNSAATVAANAALMKGQAKTDMYGGIANGLGKFLGSSFG